MKYPNIIEIKAKKSDLLRWQKSTQLTVKTFKKEYNEIPLRTTDQINRTMKTYRAFIKHVDPCSGETTIQFIKE